MLVSTAQPTPARTRTADALTDDEKAVKLACERTIRDRLEVFVEVGAALDTLAGKRLYRADYPTFDAYCRTVWGMTKQRASQLRRAALLVRRLAESTSGGPLPENERQARALDQFDPDLHIIIMKTAARRAAQLGVKMSESLIERVGRVYEQAGETGYVDVGDDSAPNAVEAALTAADVEAVKRQSEYIREKANRVVMVGQVVASGADFVRVSIDMTSTQNEQVPSPTVGQVVRVTYTPPVGTDD